ncbi:uncharacterized protein LAJ45_11168 [Morchella importuna]|uniref:uncharacterized protein n=1 Tax=Morchella importuna TaxID=1174673 RepID=UPI001E8E50A5|nr:uncharacterized protein LAJ45_11168 [Morchella importuna]KAH8144831.1 hypothetical protein LAJ45_11168 [Morchella importuna]
MAKPTTAIAPRDDSTAAPSRPDPPHPISTKSTSSSKSNSGHPVSAAAAQFHRFRLTEFNRAENPSPAASPSSASAPAGQCSRFRVTDFVPSPWSDTPTPTTPAAMSPVMMNGRSANLNGAGGVNISTGAGGGSSPSGNARQGSFSVMHMDMEGSGPQQTSTMVAAAAGSGRGVLQKVAVASPQQQQQQQQQQQLLMMSKPGTGMQQRPLAPSPMTAATGTAGGAVKPFDPATVPQEAVWELSRVLGIFRQHSPDSIVKTITDALMQWPSLAEGSLLRRIGEVFPPPPAPAPASQNGNATQEPPKKKRGRPPGKKAKMNDGTSAPQLQQQQPLIPPAQIPAPVILGPTRGKNAADKLVQCTRCLKDFNPTWRATPASDPSSEATCAVKHQFKTFEQGLEAVTLPRRKNNYKTTWKWKCCGREVQSTSDQLLMWPRKEDDRTGGWCFVGKHTTEPGVREKLGLKPGKGRKISEEIGKKRKKTSDTKEAEVAKSSDSDSWVLPETALSGYELTQPSPPAQSGYPQTESTSQSDEPPKRKRGRPKGSKTRSKVMQMSQPALKDQQQPVIQQSTGPEQQLMNEHAQSTHDPTGLGVDQSSFWTQYTEPNLIDDDGEGEDDDEEVEEADNSSEDPAISTADLSLLASATAAMTAAVQDAPIEKRKRGRPKGSRNGKMAVVDTTQKALRMKPSTEKVVNKIPPPPPPQLQPVPDPAVTGTDEGAPFVGMGGMGAMDGYGGLGSGDGGGWFG